MKNNVKVIHSGDLIELQSALIGGRTDEAEGHMTTLYCGKLDLDELHTSLYFINRTVVRLLVNEFNIPFDNADEFLISALTECMVKEHNVLHGKDEEEKHVQKYVKRYKNNH